MAKGIDTGSHAGRQVGRQRFATNSPEYIDRLPHPAQAEQRERELAEEDTTDYASIHADRLERRRPEGDTW